MTAPTATMTAEPPPVMPNPTKAPVASTQLQKLIDAKIVLKDSLADTVKEIEREPNQTKRQATVKILMETFEASLGVKCDYCHTAKLATGKPDFKAPSDNRNVTSAMWKQYVSDLKYRDGKPLFCDSCHQGQAKFFFRDSPITQTSNWMSNNFIAPFERKDGTEQACTSCHGNPFDSDIIEGMKKP
jgi:Cytochrome c7 and related cytochrome c